MAACQKWYEMMTFAVYHGFAVLDAPAVSPIMTCVVARIMTA